MWDKLESSFKNLTFKKYNKMEDNKNVFLIKSDNVNFKSYIDAVKEKKLSWDLFVQLMDDLTTNMTRQKLLISILLKEFKTFINNQCQCQLIQGKSVIQKSNFLQDYHQSNFEDNPISESNFEDNPKSESNFEDNPISESMIEESSNLESTFIHEEVEEKEEKLSSSATNITFEKFMNPLENEIGEEEILKNVSDSGNLGHNHDDIPIKNSKHLQEFPNFIGIIPSSYGKSFLKDSHKIWKCFP